MFAGGYVPGLQAEEQGPVFARLGDERLSWQQLEAVPYLSPDLLWHALRNECLQREAVGSFYVHFYFTIDCQRAEVQREAFRLPLSQLKGDRLRVPASSLTGLLTHEVSASPVFRLRRDLVSLLLDPALDGHLLHVRAEPADGPSVV